MIWLPALVLALTASDWPDSCADPYERYDIPPGGVPVQRTCTFYGRDALFLAHAHNILSSYPKRFASEKYQIEIVEWVGAYQVRMSLDPAYQIDCEARHGAILELIINYPVSDSEFERALEHHQIGVIVTVSEQNNSRLGSRFTCPAYYEAHPHPLLSDDDLWEGDG
ncbi:hypothetical protein ACWCOP_04885 [Maricaulaceae bacterium MS644]